MEPVASRNQITLRGSLRALPEFSHENHGKRFYRFFLEVPRLSGAVDTLPVIAEETILNTVDPSGGEMLTVTGEVRSHNLRDNGKRHLSVFVFAASIAAEDGEPINTVLLDAIVCREPTYRRTPLGREICDVMLAVPQGFSPGGLSSLYPLGQSCRRSGPMHRGGPVDYQRTSPKPHLYQADRRGCPGTDNL